jgi:hypothetical protein
MKKALSGAFLISRLIYNQPNYYINTMQKKNRKVNNPKIYLVNNVIFPYELDDSDSKDFLQNPKVQEQFFKSGNMLVDDILVKVWLTRYAERDLILKNKLAEIHPFLSRVMTLIELHPNIQKEMYEFLTMMYFEDNSICKHWDFSNKIKTETLDNIICKSISQNSKSLSLFIDNLGQKRVESVKYTWENNPNKEPLDIKTMALIDALKSWGAQRTNYKLLVNEIDKLLNIPNNYELLFKYVDRKSIYYYDLQKLEMPKLGQYVIEHDFNGVKINTSVENLSKYNSMEKGLSNCMQGQEGYDLNGRQFDKKNFDELVRSFYQHPFLKYLLVNFILAKAANAVKAENRSLWQYAAVKLDIGNNPNKGEGKSKKVVKI